LVQIGAESAPAWRGFAPLLSFGIEPLDIGFFELVDFRGGAIWVGLLPAQCWRLLNMLEADGVLAVVKRGNQRAATRYRFTGDTR
jgi:hypothetical protein